MTLNLITPIKSPLTCKVTYRSRGLRCRDFRGHYSANRSIFLWFLYLVGWMVAPIGHTHVHIPGTCEYYLIWDVVKLRFLKWDYPRLHLWVLNPMLSIFIRDRRRHRYTDKKTMWGWRQILEWCGHKWKKPRNVDDYQKLEKEARKNSLLELLKVVLPCWYLHFRF